MPDVPVVPTLYMFDPQTQHYTGSRPAQIVGGVPLLLSAHATTAAPPAVQTGHVPHWTGEGWEIIDAPPVPEPPAPPPAPPALTLAEAKTKAVEQVKSASDRFGDYFWPGLKRTAALTAVAPFGPVELDQLKSFCGEVLATQTSAVQAIQAAPTLEALAEVMADLRAMYGEYLV